MEHKKFPERVYVKFGTEATVRFPRGFKPAVSTFTNKKGISETTMEFGTPKLMHLSKEARFTSLKGTPTKVVDCERKVYGSDQRCKWCDEGDVPRLQFYCDVEIRDPAGNWDRKELVISTTLGRAMDRKVTELMKRGSEWQAFAYHIKSMATADNRTNYVITPISPDAVPEGTVPDDPVEAMTGGTVFTVSSDEAAQMKQLRVFYSKHSPSATKDEFIDGLMDDPFKWPGVRATQAVEMCYANHTLDGAKIDSLVTGGK
jgi:hypothetical protein